MVTIQLSAAPSLATAWRAQPPTFRARRLLCWLVVVTALLGALLVARAGCERMMQAAPRGSSDSQGRVVAGYGWSMAPIGFTVRYRDGGAMTRLWW